MKKIVAVTACPTGIAHTFMAAEKLEEAAKKLGIEIKVETNGSAGAENVLSSREIEEAECVIVAADTKVEMDRFNGKHVIQTSVSSAIHKAEDLINRAINQNAPVYTGKGNNTQGVTSNTSVIGTIYKHLMNGVSNMIPFVVAGGILIALAFVFDYKNAGAGNFGWGNDFSIFLGDTGKAALGFMLPILAAFIAYSISDRPGLVVGFVGGYLAGQGGSGFLGAIIAGFAAGYIIVLLKYVFSSLPKSLDGIKPILLYPLIGVAGIAGVMILVNYFMEPINSGLANWLNEIDGSHAIILGLLLGGMMAVDMGGPINKTAYLFGTATVSMTVDGELVSVSSQIMAAVMAGGMVPPLGIALATTLFPNLFTKQEREAGKVNYVMGISFITEGAIPFAAARPLKVLPSIIIGSAVAGALSMWFKVSTPAPHGGLFVIPVMDGWYMYIVALAIGTVVTAALLRLILPIKIFNK
ncbi:PTS system fructose-specific IIABC component protein [Haloplasma contractile SSD-17B]|uniref:PTS system fructose-specific IIABC component protein n=1 Tax=Haloplasma contractile SSD-17B TaxID=1033810 RepID=U2FSC6_9MOLU|nr:fructose-specific PTS transporter subunit EIIC [Haloplasma contractile]ERJ13844.1 PTS system fructose-specific IIABC component protein [Haloplasma contractile SSD-17B]